MSLKETIDQKLKQAMKSRDEITVSTLRLINAAVKNKEIDAKKSLEDADVIAVVTKMVKQCKESIELFQKGNRADLVEKTNKELAVLTPLLPAQLSSEELKKKVQEIVKEVGATTPKEMGAVMKSVQQHLSGRADMKEASRLVRELLSS